MTITLAALLARMTGVVIAVAAVTQPAASYAGNFQDPLDASARPTPLASKSQLITVTRAGQSLVAVGWRGHIVVSSDAGASWTQAAVPVKVDLTSVHFATPTDGWAVGHAGVVLRTSDGGKSWVRQLDGRTAGKLLIDHYERLSKNGESEAARLLKEVKLSWERGPELPWLDVYFTDAKSGFVVGPFNMILSTQDGGKSWMPILERIPNPEGLHLNSVSEIGGDLFIASERGTVFRLAAGTDRFSALQTGYAGTLFGVCGRKGLLLAYGLQGTLLRSTDGGGSWQRVESGVQTSIVGCDVTERLIVLAGQGGQILVGGEAGQKFTALKTSTLGPVFSVVVSAPDVLVSVGQRGASKLPLPATQ